MKRTTAKKASHAKNKAKKRYTTKYGTKKSGNVSVLSTSVRAAKEGNFPVTLKTFDKVWEKHPGGEVYPCEQALYPNQCAIRLGKALDEAGFSISTFTGARCALHDPRHIRGAQDLADWLRNTKRQGEPTIIAKGADRSQMDNAKGIVFIQNGWPEGGDHIDLWDDPALAGGDSDWLDRGKLWFWKVK